MIRICLINVDLPDSPVPAIQNFTLVQSNYSFCFSSNNQLKPIKQKLQYKLNKNHFLKTKIFKFQIGSVIGVWNKKKKLVIVTSCFSINRRDTSFSCGQTFADERRRDSGRIDREDQVGARRTEETMTELAGAATPPPPRQGMNERDETTTCKRLRRPATLLRTSPYFNRHDLSDAIITLFLTTFYSVLFFYFSIKNINFIKTLYMTHI